MRWLLISSQHHPTHGGIGTYISQFVRAANAEGWTVDLVTRPSRLHPAGARIHAISTLDSRPEFADRIGPLRRIERIRPYRYALWSLAVAERLLNLRSVYDAVEFVDCQAEGFASMCSERVRGHFAGVPMIVHAHTPMFIEEEINRCDSNRFGRSIYHGWERRTLAAADGVIVTSTLLGERMPAATPQAVIQYPINDDSVKPARTAREETILFVGSIQPRKGVGTWAESLNGVFDRRPAARAVMVGPDTPNGPEGTSMVEHVRRLVRREHSHRLHWIGQRDHAEVLNLIGAAALVVVPSVFESFSFVAAESLLRRTPVLVSDAVGIAEHIEGLPRCPANDVRAWSEAQVAMLADLARSISSADSHRRQLRHACSPSNHLRRRTEFMKSLHAARLREWDATASPDSMDELRGFIAEVESAEQAVGSASMVGS